MYDVCTERWGVKKYPKLAEKQYIKFGQRGMGGKKIPNICGRHIWKPPTIGAIGSTSLYLTRKTKEAKHKLKALPRVSWRARLR